MLWFQLGPTASLVLANPSGEQVIAGGATFDRAGSTLTINQGTDKVIINWQDFSIGAGELTNFIQPSATSAALNRVISQNVSEIYGTLQANGQIYLINPNGLVVGASGVINTQSFIASTHDVSNSEFLAGGDLQFKSQNVEGRIKNLGNISADGGDIILIAQEVENAGTLSAPDGTVALAAGTEVLVKASGEERVFIQAAADDSDFEIRNLGLIQAATAELKAAGGNEYALAINNTGVVRATGAHSSGGRVFLRAAGGTVRNSGSIEGAAVVEAEKAELDAEEADVVLGQNTAGYTGSEDLEFINVDQVTISRAGDGSELWGTSGNDVINVTLIDEDTIVYAFENGTEITLDGLRQFSIQGGDGDDWVNFDASAGGSLLANGIDYDGNGPATLPGDGMSVIGDGVDDSLVYAPDAVTFGDGTFIFNGGEIRFRNLEPIDVSGMANATVALPGADDILTVENGVDFTTGTQDAIRVSGTSGGVAIETVAFFNNTTVTIDTSATSDGNDTITIASADNSHGNENLIFTTGVGTDSIELDGTITTTGNQIFNGDVLLTGPGNLFRLFTAGGDVTFNGDINSASSSLLVNATGDLTFNGSVGNVTRPGSIEATAQTIFLNGGDISVSDRIIFYSPIVLGADTNILAVSSNLSFRSTIDGAHHLTVTALQNAGGIQNLTFFGDVGSSAPLASLTINADEELSFLGGASSVTTLGNQTYNGQLNLIQDTVFAVTASGQVAFPQGLVNDGLDLTILNVGDITFDTSLQRNGGGDVNLVSGWDGTTAFDLTTFLNADLATTTLFGNSSRVRIGDGSQTTGIAVGSRNGSTNVFTGRLSLNGSGSADGFSQLGFQATDGIAQDGSNLGAARNINGDILIRAVDDIVASGGSGLGAYAQVGHIGMDTLSNTTVDGNSAGSITFETGGLTFEGGSGLFSYVQLGHGGYGSRGDFTGDITSSAAGQIDLRGGTLDSAYAQLGHGGDLTQGTVSGSITITTADELALIAGTGSSAYSQLGHGGLGAVGDYSGTIDITVDGVSDMIGQNASTEYAHLGHRGITTSTVSGDITLRVAGNLELANGFIGHQAPTFSSGNTFLGIVGNLTADANSRFNSALSASGGELRLYVGGSDNVNTAALLNGVAHGGTAFPNNQGSFAFGEGPYVAEFSYYNFAVQYDYIVGATEAAAIVAAMAGGDVSLDSTLNQAAFGAFATFDTPTITVDAAITQNNDNNLSFVTLGDITINANIDLEDFAFLANVGEGDFTLTSTSGNIILDANVTTGDTLTFNAPVILNRDITTQAKTTVFNDTIDSASGSHFSLHVSQRSSNTGNMTFAGQIGATDALSSFTTSGLGTTIFNVSSGGTLLNPTVQATGDINLGTSGLIGGATRLDQDTALVSATGSVTVAGNVNGQTAGTSSLIVSSETGTTLGNNIGNSASLNELTVTGNGALILNTTTFATSVQTEGFQQFGTDVTLTRDVTFDSNADANITFDGTVNGAVNAVFNTGGTLTFNAAIGDDTALTSITTDAGGTTVLSGTSLATTGVQDFGDQVSIPGAFTFSNSTANSDINFKGGLMTGDADTDLIVLATGNILINGSIQYDGTGNTNFVAGWDGTTAFDAATFLAEDVTTTTVFGNSSGSVLVGDGTQGSAVAVGSRNGFTNVLGHDVNVQAKNGTGSGWFAQIGFNATDQGAAFTINGDINVLATNDINAIGGDTTSNVYAQIGHVGMDLAFNGVIEANVDADISITAGNDLNVIAGDGFAAYAQLGHGGRGALGNFEGDILINRADAITFNGAAGNQSYAQLGHGGRLATGTHSGTITITEAGDISFNAGSDFAAYAQLGHGGHTAAGSHSGAILITRAGELSFIAGSDSETYAQLGHGGRLATGSHSGTITITEADDVSFTAGSEFVAYAQLGHGGRGTAGSHSGNIEIGSAGFMSFAAGSENDAYAQLGHGGAFAFGDHSGMITLSEAGNLEFIGGSDFSTYAQLGHGGRQAQGNHSGAILISQAGTLTFAGGTDTASYSQLGHGGNDAIGNHSGSITITEAGNTTFAAGSFSAQAQLGHGGNNADGDHSGNISLTSTGTVTLTGINDVRYARIGHGDEGGDSDAGDTVSGDVMVQARGDVELTFAQIGHEVDADGGYTSGNTYIGAVGNLVADADSEFRSALDADGGELRFYVGGSDNVNTATLLNGVAHGGTAFPNNQGAFGFGEGPYNVPGADVAGEFNYYNLLAGFSYQVDAAEAAAIVAALAGGDVALDSTLDQAAFGAFFAFVTPTITIDAAIAYNQTNDLTFTTLGDIIINQDITNGSTAGGDLTLTSSSGSITIDTGSIITGGAQTYHSDMVLNTDVMLASNSLTAGSISFAGAITTATGAENFTVNAAQNILLNPGSSITTTTGNITLNANTAGTATGNFTAIHLNDADIQTTSGAISLTGEGSNSTGSSSFSSNRYGILLSNGATISSTESTTKAGSITLTGTGASTGSGNVEGVALFGFGNSSQINSVTGDISITGTGTGRIHQGVRILSPARINSTGTGANAARITVQGNGSFGNNTAGILVAGVISSVDGDIGLTGTSGFRSGGRHTGISVTGRVESTGTGSTAASITLEGTGGTGGLMSHGVVVGGGANSVSSVDGDITITGTADTSRPTAENRGILLRFGGGVTTTGDADLTLISDDMDFDGTGSVASLTGLGDLTIKPLTANASIGIGDGSTGTLNLTTADLAIIADGFNSITIGDTTAGDGAVDVQDATFLDPITIAGKSVTVNGVLDAGANDITFDIGIVSDGTATLNNTVATTGNFIINGGAFDDSLVIDFTTGTPVPASGLAFAGNGEATAAGDSITLNNGTFTTVTHTFTTATSGTIDMDGAVVTYTGLDPIFDNLSVTDRVFDYRGLNALPFISDTVTLSDDATAGNNISFIDSSLGEEVTFVNPTDSLTILTNGGSLLDPSAAFDITLDGIDSLFEADLTVSGDFNDDLFVTGTFAIGRSSIDFDARSIEITGTLSTENNNRIQIDALRNVFIDGGQIITERGNIRIRGNSDGSFFGDFDGIEIVGGAEINTQDGDITLNANGGDSGDGNEGIEIEDSSIVQATGTGSITITGRGGGDDTGDNSSEGVQIDDAFVRVTDGNLIIDGRGSSSGSENEGVEIQDGALVQSTGTGTITIEGIGRGDDRSNGVKIEDAQVISVTGAIAITGESRGSGDIAEGVVIEDGAQVASTGTGASAATITINGIGGDGNEFLSGVSVLSNARITSFDGDISIIGQGGNGAEDGVGVVLFDGALIRSDGTGVDAAKITIQGNGGVGEENNLGILVSGAGVFTSDGDIEVTGVAGSDGTGDDNIGIQISDASVITANGDGAVTLHGTGGDGVDDNLGVFIEDSFIDVTDGNLQITGIGGMGTGENNIGTSIGSNSGVFSFGAGTITINGTGGTGTNGRLGIEIFDGTSIQTLNSNITIVGTGGAGTGEDAFGFGMFAGSQVFAAGSGNIQLTGNAGNGGTDELIGVFILGGPTPSRVASEDGDVTIQGTGGNGSGDFNIGVSLFEGGLVQSTGNGNISITGVAGTGVDNNYGVEITRDSTTGTGSGVTAANGNIVITGTGSGSEGIFVNNRASLEATNGTLVTETLGGDIDINGVITADFLEVLGTAAATGFFTNNANNVGTLAGAIGALDFENSADLAIGVVNSSNGITTQLADGIQIEVRAGNLTQNAQLVANNGGQIFLKVGRNGSAEMNLNAMQTTTGNFSAEGGSDADTFNLAVVSSTLEVNGRNGDDVFNIGNAGNSLDDITADISVLGGGASDTLNINDQGDTDANIYQIGDDNRIQRFNGVDIAITYNNATETINLNGGTSPNDVLRGSDSDDTFMLTGAESGVFSNPALSSDVNWTGIALFDGQGDDNDTLDYSGLAGPVTFVTGVTGVNIENIFGSASGADMVQGSAGSETFEFNGNTITFGAVTLTGFEIVDGDDGSDVFDFIAGLTTILVQGNDGDDRFNYLGGSTAAAAEGGAGNDTFSFTLANYATPVAFAVDGGNETDGDTVEVTGGTLDIDGTAGTVTDGNAVVDFTRDIENLVVSSSTTVVNNNLLLPGMLDVDASGDVTWNGSITAYNVQIQGNTLFMNNNVTSTAGGITLVANTSFQNNGSALNPASRFLVYSVDPFDDTLGGLTGSAAFGLMFPDLPGFSGNGFVYSTSLNNSINGQGVFLNQQLQNALTQLLMDGFEPATVEKLAEFLNSEEGQKLLLEGGTDKDALQNILLWLSSFDVAQN